MFACMTGAAPQPANQRKLEDAMEVRLAELDGVYSPALVSMVRACLALDPLARPQSVFALQKVLGEALPAATAAKKQAAPRAPGGLRGLVGKIGALTRGKT
jgi:hypothetical protein